MFEIIKYFYKNGQYSKDDVATFLASHIITEEEFNEITTEKLTEEEFNEITTEKLTEEELDIMNSKDDSEGGL